MKLFRVMIGFLALIWTGLGSHSNALAQQTLEDAVRERIMGQESAPLKITLYSSFSCSHCSDLYLQAIIELKNSHIDTGQAHLVFSDFPLNAPALHATMLTRCISTDRYFELVEELFATQRSWAYEENYLELLEAKATVFGLSAKQFRLCVENEDLQSAILHKLREANERWSFSSVPAVVINDTHKFTFPPTTDDYKVELERILVDY